MILSFSKKVGVGCNLGNNIIVFNITTFGVYNMYLQNQTNYICDPRVYQNVTYTLTLWAQIDNLKINAGHMDWIIGELQ